MEEAEFEDELHHDDLPLGAEADPGAVAAEEGQEEPGPGLETCKVCKTCDEDLPLSCYACVERSDKLGNIFPYYSATCIKDENTIETLQKIKKESGVQSIRQNGQHSRKTKLASKPR